MYLPQHFKEEDVATLHRAIAGAGLATLVTMSAGGLVASHVPLLLDREPAPFGTLHGHLARANPQWREASAEIEALAIFQGPDAYVSPSLYATKRLTGRVVPTWNYVAIHAYGRIAFFDDAERLLALVTGLTRRHEAARPAPWAVSDAPADFVAGQLRGIVGFELALTRIEGKWKMSQNRPAEDRPGIAAGLAAEGKSEVAAAVRERSGL